MKAIRTLAIALLACAAAACTPSGEHDSEQAQLDSDVRRMQDEARNDPRPTMPARGKAKGETQAASRDPLAVEKATYLARIQRALDEHYDELAVLDRERAKTKGDDRSAHDELFAKIVDLRTTLAYDEDLVRHSADATWSDAKVKIDSDLDAYRRALELAHSSGSLDREAP